MIERLVSACDATSALRTLAAGGLGADSGVFALHDHAVVGHGIAEGVGYGVLLGVVFGVAFGTVHGSVFGVGYGDERSVAADGSGFGPAECPEAA